MRRQVNRFKHVHGNRIAIRIKHDGWVAQSCAPAIGVQPAKHHTLLPCPLNASQLVMIGLPRAQRAVAGKPR